MKTSTFRWQNHCFPPDFPWKIHQQTGQVGHFAPLGDDGFCVDCETWELQLGIMKRYEIIGDYLSVIIIGDDLSVSYFFLKLWIITKIL